MSNRLFGMIKKKNKESKYKYDLIEVRVKIGNKFYNYSRFLVSRLLSVTGIKLHDSIKIATNLKKFLVDSGRYVIKQKKLEHLIFQKIREFGYGEKKINRFKVMMQYHQERIPILVLLFGTSCAIKSQTLSKLSELLNITAVLQTDIIYELYQSTVQEDKSKTNFAWLQKFSSQKDMVDTYIKQSKILHKCLDGDIKKCFHNGKNIIVTGTHLNPILFNEVLNKYKLNKTDYSNGIKERGIVVPFFITNRNKDKTNVFIEQFYGRLSKEIRNNLSIEDLNKNFDSIEAYFENQNPDYKLEKILIDQKNMKAIMKDMQKIFIRHMETNFHILDNRNKNPYYEEEEEEEEDPDSKRFYFFKNNDDI